jgi:hypothetical protein
MIHCAQMPGMQARYGTDDNVRLLANASSVKLYGGNGGNDLSHGKPLRVAWYKRTN